MTGSHSFGPTGTPTSFVMKIVPPGAKWMQPPGLGGVAQVQGVPACPLWKS